MPRGTHLTVSVILAKAIRQGATADQLLELSVRLAFLTGQEAPTLTGSARVHVGDLLRSGIRLHPFTLSSTSIATPTT